MGLDALSRREALRELAVAVAGVAAGACSPAPAQPPVLAAVPLADLAGGRRAVVEVKGFPVEVAQEAGAVSARYLLCTHMGCRVTWDDNVARYLCACHEGAFARDGRPLAGPATEPLTAVPFEIERGEVVFR